jgi:hypothetical protein
MALIRHRIHLWSGGIQSVESLTKSLSVAVKMVAWWQKTPTDLCGLWNIGGEGGGGCQYSLCSISVIYGRGDGLNLWTKNLLAYLATKHFHKLVHECPVTYPDTRMSPAAPGIIRWVIRPFARCISWASGCVEMLGMQYDGILLHIRTLKYNASCIFHTLSWQSPFWLYKNLGKPYRSSY